MALRFAPGAAIAACNAIVDLVDVGAGNGRLDIFTSPRPPTPDSDVTTQILLVSFPLAKPAFGDAEEVLTGGGATLNTVPAAEPVGSGEANWFRVYDGDGNAVFDGGVFTHPAADLEVSTLDIEIGTPVTIVNLSFIQPHGY